MDDITVTVKYDRDAPIDGSVDAPDGLSRINFSKHLAEILHTPPNEECFTASLEGGWGYGKSSIIEMTKAQLKAIDSPPIIIEFNPWLVGDVKSLIQKFLIQFAAQLNIPDRPKEALAVAKELLAYSKLFDVAKLIPGAEPWATTFQTVFRRLGKATTKIAELKKLDLEGRKNKVQEAVGKLDRSIVVFIDDIDRLTPDEAFEVIKLSKAIANFKGTSFLLAFDHVYLADALERYGIKNSGQYVEKVVQLRIPLPLIAKEDLHVLSEQLLSGLSQSSLTDKFEEDQERLSYIYHQQIKHLVKTPRELKRIFNHLRFVLAQTEGEVCFTDVYALSVIAVKFPVIYEHIKNSPYAYVGESFGDTIRLNQSDEVVDQSKGERENVVDSLAPNEKGYVYALLRELFPLTDSESYSLYSSDYDRNGRVASINRLYVALHYQVPKSLLSDTGVAAFIDGKVSRQEYLQQVIDDCTTERLFDLLSHNLEKVLPNTNAVLNALFDSLLYSEVVRDEANQRLGGLSVSTFRRIVWLTINLIELTENKKSIIFHCLDEPRYVPITANLLHRMMAQHREVQIESNNKKEDPWLNHEDYIEAKRKWLSQVKGQFNNMGFLQSVHASHVYFQLLRLDPKFLHDQFTQWIDEPNGLQKIALLIGRCGTDSTNGPYAQIDREDLGRLVDIELITNLVNDELKKETDLSNYFKAVYSSIATGDPYYLNDATKGNKF